MDRLLSFRQLLALSLALSLTAVAHATPTVPPPDLYTIHGIVRDPIQRLMDFVRVQADPVVCNGLPESCTSRSDVTNSVGVYEIGESATGTFQLTASRDDVVATVTPVTVAAPIPTQVDLVVKYRISGTLFRTALSTANGPASTSLTITSYAPLPGVPGQTGGASCVKVTDSRTGITTDASLTSNDGRTSTWTYTLSASQGTAEGTYRLSFEADDCATGTMLTVVGTADYTVDNTAPQVFFRSPIHEGNTYYDAFPMLVSLVDQKAAASGLGTGVDATDPNAVSVQLQTVGGGSPTSPPFTVSSNVVRASLSGLQRGAQYDATVSAIDRAGNAGSQSVRFGVMNSLTTPAPGTVRLRIASRASDSMDPGGTLEATDTYYWGFVPVQVDPFSVTLSGTFHTGNGTILLRVPLSQLNITYAVGGQPFTLNTAVFPPTGPDLTSVGFAVGSLGTVTTSVPAQTGRLWQIAARLPKGVDAGSARLALDSFATSVQFSLCADKAAASDFTCSVDPEATISTPFLPLCTLIPSSQDDSDSAGAPEEGNICYSPNAGSLLNVLSVATPPDLAPEATSASSDPRRRNLGVRVYPNRQLLARGIGSRLQVGNPNVSHTGPVCGGDPEFFAGRPMMKKNNHSGLGGYKEYHFVEAGWMEVDTSGADIPVTYFNPYENMYGNDCCPDLTYGSQSLERGHLYLFFVRRSEAPGRNNVWSGHIYFGGQWNQIADGQAMPFTLGDEPESMWEIRQACSSTDITVTGDTYMGEYSDVRGIRVRDAQGVLRKWTSGNYPSAGPDGTDPAGPTATNSTGSCIAHTSSTCYSLLPWSGTWYYNRIYDPPG